MTKDQFITIWITATPAQRFTAFVEWVTDSIPGLPQWVDPTFQLVSGPSSGNCPNYQLSLSEFQNDSPDDACNLGYAIIAQCSNLAQANYTDAYKKKEKARQKQIDKWLDKMKKELFKDMSGAYKEMAKYYAKKYEIEKGS